MGNFKVKVNSEAESKEAQELFFQLGYSKGACSEGNYPADIIAVPRGFFSETPFSSRSVKLDHEEHEGYKELTLSELHAMVNPSLNDQYAEIEQVRQAIKVPDGNDSDHAVDAMSFGLMGVGRDKVRQTLNERQSQYGSFKDVADTTSVFMDQFALGYMSNVQREALHMICSKLARIANGDPNHVDSWHDIAGYATLVVDDLES